MSRVARPAGGYLGFHIMKQDRGTPSQSQTSPPPAALHRTSLIICCY